MKHLHTKTVIMYYGRSSLFSLLHREDTNRLAKIVDVIAVDS